MGHYIEKYYPAFVGVMTFIALAIVDSTYVVDSATLRFIYLLVVVFTMVSFYKITKGLELITNTDTDFAIKMRVTETYKKAIKYIENSVTVIVFAFLGFLFLGIIGAELTHVYLGVTMYLLSISQRSFNLISVIFRCYIKANNKEFHGA